MHCQTLARGVSITADARMFNIAELVTLVRAAGDSGFRCKVRITKSQTIGQRDKARILASADDQKRVLFV